MKIATKIKTLFAITKCFFEKVLLARFIFCKNIWPFHFFYLYLQAESKTRKRICTTTAY